MDNKTPSIYDYLNYRSFLKDYYIFRKSIEKNFSHRFIVSHTGATSSGWFSDIINNRINLTKNFTAPLCNLLKLKSREIEFFEYLVEYDQAGTFSEKNRYLERIISFKEINPSLIGKDQFDFYSKWYISAIRELLFFYDFDDDIRSLARMLNPPIRITEAQEAIDVLISIGFIKKNGQGYYKPVMQTITKDSAFKTVHWANLITSMLKLAIESVNRHTTDKRDLSAVTINLSEESLITAKAEISALRKKLLSLSEHDQKQNTVYQCNIQLFPLSQNLKEKK